MKKYVSTKYGIRHLDGKIVNRVFRGGVKRQFFRDKLGQEYPIERAADTLTEAQATQFEEQKRYLDREAAIWDRMKYPENYE